MKVIFSYLKKKLGGCDFRLERIFNFLKEKIRHFVTQANFLIQKLELTFLVPKAQPEIDVIMISKTFPPENLAKKLRF
jgi:hypothetical protein